jgi:acyl carrier protein phosphodiesterase
MNHLAHLFLAQATVASRTGNLMGDFARGIDTSQLREPVRLGLINHRAIDAFTDQHPSVVASRRLFSAQRRRFAGIALDILYDHLLIRHWQRFARVDREPFIARLYQDLEQNQNEMPAKMASVVSLMVQHDWFGAYGELDKVGYALDRVAGRIRFSNRFSGVIEELNVLYEELEDGFLEFFPDLLSYVEQQAIETGAPSVYRESTPWIRYTSRL